MPSVYHAGTSCVNSTSVHAPVATVEAAQVHPTLRKTFTTIQALTRRHGYCYASFAYIAQACSLSVASIRRHVRQLIAAGIIRREEVPGYADRLFICPSPAPILHPVCTPIEQTQQMRDSVAKRKEDKQQTTAPQCPTAAPHAHSVVVPSAIAQNKGEQAEETADPIPTCGKTEQFEKIEELRTEHLTADQLQTITALVQAGIAWRLAEETARQDRERAQGALRALLAAQQRQGVPNGGGFYRQAFREGWTASERRTHTASGMARDAGLVIAPTGSTAPTTPPPAQGVQGMIAALRAGVLKGARMPT